MKLLKGTTLKSIRSVKGRDGSKGNYVHFQLIYAGPIIDV